MTNASAANHGEIYLDYDLVKQFGRNLASQSHSRGDATKAWELFYDANARNIVLGKKVPLDHPETQTTLCDAFSQAAKDIANGVWSPSDQHLHQRLMVQLQADADEIRKTCTIVRDPTAPRVITYKSGDDLMAVTRRLCLGQ